MESWITLKIWFGFLVGGIALVGVVERAVGKLRRLYSANSDGCRIFAVMAGGCLLRHRDYVLREFYQIVNRTAGGNVNVHIFTLGLG
jgi:hypothetical protein